MEEVDFLIIHQLKQINGDFDNEYTSLRELDYETIMRCLIGCISLIDPNLTPGLTIAPQSNMASKYKLCTSLADICVELGFKGDLGYQTLLYCNETDLRRLFLFLLEKIPKDETQDMSTLSITGNTLVERLCKKPVSLTWLPPMSTASGSKSAEGACYWKTLPINGILNATSIVGNRIAPSKRNYLDNCARLPFHEIASLMEWNSASMDPTYIRLTSSKRKIAENIEFIGQKTIFSADDDKRETLSPTETTLSSGISESSGGKGGTEARDGETDVQEILKQEIASMEELIDKSKQRLSRFEATISEQNQSLKLTEDILQSESDKLISMRTSDKTVTHLVEQVNLVQADLDSFQEQWEVIRGQLMGKIEAVKEEKLALSRHRNQLIQEIHRIRKTGRGKLKELTEKDRLISELKDQISKPLPPNRASYTQRIMELVNNVKKQNNETRKILLETRQLQKDINIVSGKVRRSYTITDETIFRDAKNSDWNRKCYKLLATLHKNYDTLLDCVNAIGTIRRETLQLEETIETEKRNKSIANLDRIQQDLAQLQSENQLLMNK